MKKEVLRSEIEEKYKWDLTKFCKDDETWYKEFEELKKELPKISEFKGKLNDKKKLKEFFDFLESFGRKNAKLGYYTFLNVASDLNNAKYAEMDGLINSFDTKVGEALSFYSPELLSYDQNYLKDLMKDPDFKDYDFSFLKLLRQKPHILSEKEEALLSKSAIFASDYRDIMETFFSVNLKCEDAIDSKGEKHLLNDTTFGSMLFSPDRELRKDAYLKYNKAVKEQANTTIAKLFISNLKKDAFYAQTSNYKDTLTEKLYSNDMEVGVYDRLLSNAHTRLDTVERYHKAKKNVLGFNKLQPWDRLCSMASGDNEKYTFEKSCDILREVFKPLGEEYVKMFNTAIKDRWIDVFPSKGKRGGAFQTGTYGISPVIMLNHTDDYNSVSTLAHEFGHAMHSYYSDKTQCEEKAGYTIFCAEIASTTNEILLNEYFLAKTKDKEKRLFYLDDIVNGFQSTFYRQTMFAEFERFAHDLVDNDKPISHEILNKKYEELNKKYLVGIEPNEYMSYGWVGIPHFYSKFYVWQYATGITCAINFASAILQNKPNALENYMNFLKSGGKDFPLEILKECGIDLNTNKPYEVAFDYVDKHLKEIELIVNEKKRNNEIEK